MTKFNDFYEAWWYLYDHEMFIDKNGMSHFEECTDICPVKVNPLNDKIDDDDALNTKTRVWIETGKYIECGIEHDIELDSSGDTYEEAITELANLVGLRD